MTTTETKECTCGCEECECEEKTEETYTSNFGKKRPKPQDKMIREHSDK